MNDTRVLSFFSIYPEQSLIEEAAAVLRNGGIVAFPTETVYGLGADARNPDAVAKVFHAKGRPADNPLIVHIAATGQLYEFGTDISPVAKALAEAFMPGPLTLVVKHAPHVPPIVTAGLDTVALRMPNHAVPLALIKTLNSGIVGPSANISGKPSPTTAQHVLEDLNGKIDMILDAGPTQIGVESTVIDTTSTPPAILRPGGITQQQIESVIGHVRLSAEISELKRSPGTRHRHYAPRARVFVIEPGNVERLRTLWNDFSSQRKNIRTLIYSSIMKENLTISFDTLPSNVEGYSRQLFSSLRKLDSEGAEIILIEAVEETGLGMAVMDRLRRSAEASEQ